MEASRFIATLTGHRDDPGYVPTPEDALRAAVFMVFYQEVTHELLPARRQRSVPRQVKCKMTRWLVKRVPKPPRK